MTMQTDLKIFEAVVAEHLAVLFDSDVDLLYMAREWLKVIDYNSVRCFEAYEAGEESDYLDYWGFWYARRRELLDAMWFPEARVIVQDFPELEGATEALLVAWLRSAVEERSA